MKILIYLAALFPFIANAGFGAGVNQYRRYPRPKPTRPTEAFLAAKSQVAVKQMNDSQFTDLCSYDHFCFFLTDDSGSDKPKWVKPDPGVLNDLLQYKDQIKRIATKMGVDPRAVAGAILADHSLTPSTADGGIAHDHIQGLSNLKGVNGHYIHSDTVVSAEFYIAKIEGRPVRPLVQVLNALDGSNDLTGLIYYTSAIIRQSQDAYRRVGVDVSKDIGVLDTLYNLGLPEKKAANLATRLKSLKDGNSEETIPSPRPNFFGYFVNHNLDVLEAFKAFPGTVQLATPTAEPIAAPELDSKYYKEGYQTLKLQDPNNPRAPITNDDVKPNVAPVITVQ